MDQNEVEEEVKDSKEKEQEIQTHVRRPSFILMASFAKKAEEQEVCPGLWNSSIRKVVFQKKNSSRA